MHPLQSLIDMTEFAGRNFAYNLGFLPEDKLSFKASATAKSAAEITQEASEYLLRTKAVLSGGSFNDVNLSVPTSREEAQEMVKRAASEYAEWLQTQDVSRFGESVELPFGTMPRGQVVTMPVVDLVHHHGQIAYIQTILGDTESHFYTMDASEAQ